MRRPVIKLQRLCICLFVLLVTACGGSGGSGEDALPAFSTILIAGDSISRYDQDPNAYAYADYLLLPDTVLNQAVPGTRLVDQIATSFSANLDLLPDADGVIIQGGTNDLIQWDGSTPDDAAQLVLMQAAITAMSSEALSRDLQVLYVNILPWGGTKAWSLEKQQFTDEYNAWLSSYAGQTGALYVDAYSLLQAQSGWDERIATVYGGPLHPNEAGAIALAAEVEAVIQAYRDSQ